jgi:thiol-disulfide isomerase/thioredoxin
MVLTSLMSAALALTMLSGGIAEPAAPTTPVVEPAKYAQAAWPAHNPTVTHAKDLQGQRLPVSLGQETWLTEKQDLTGKVLVLDFWATWCGPCIAATPKLTNIQRTHQGHLAVVGISGQREGIEKVQSYLESKKPTFAYVHDAEQRVYKPFEARAIPLVVVVSTDGVIRWMGNPHEKAFEEIVKQVVEADPLIKANRAG